MGGVAGKLSVFAVAIVLALGAAACGGGDEDPGSEAGTTTSAQPGPNEGASGAGGGGRERKEPAEKAGSGESQPESGTAEAAPEQTRHQDSGGGSGQFRVPGGDNSIQEFGREAEEAEFDQAALAVHGFFDARVKGEWGRACSFLARDVIETLMQLAGEAGGDCATVFGQISEGAPQAAFRLAAQADIGSLRIGGGQAFVLYHGAANLDYAMPMTSEGGEWKVASLAGTQIS